MDLRMLDDPRLHAAIEEFAALMRAWSQALPKRVDITPRDLLRSPRTPQASPRISRNGSAHLLRGKDGWLALNLPRASDIDLIPALIGLSPAPDTWLACLKSHAQNSSVQELYDTACLLGLAAALPNETTPAPKLALPSHSLKRPHKPPLVLDMSALWAGPLCGGLLARGGCQVIKLELSHRPDTTAQSDPALHHRLNGAKQGLRLDLQSPTDRETFAQYLDRADLLITSARPAALEALIGSWHPDRPWIRICGHEQALDRIGFGDDCAIAGGLYLEDPSGPVFLGDAIADPLSGIYAAVRACQALALGQCGRIYVGLSGVSGRVAAGGLIA